MKTLYYYFRWLLKQYRYSSFHLAIPAVSLFFTGMIMNIVGATIHSKIDETGTIHFYKDDYWQLIGDKFIYAGFFIFGIFVFTDVIAKSLIKSFRQFKTEQYELLRKIDRG